MSFWEIDGFREIVKETSRSTRNRHLLSTQTLKRRWMDELPCHFETMVETTWTFVLLKKTT